MKTQNKGLLQEVYWEDIRKEVQKINPILAAIIDEISPGHAYSFIKASYDFGDTIVKDGILHLPIENNLLPITDKQVGKNIQVKLAYTPIPLSLSLNRANEVFLYEEERTIPLNVMYPGEVFGTYETIAYLFKRFVNPIWNVTAGCRTLFTLPKISEQLGFKRLRRSYNLPPGMKLKHLHDHWTVFKRIANYPGNTNPWQSDILFFTKNWFEHDRKDPIWFQFERFIFGEAWSQAEYGINRKKFGILWQKIAKKIGDRRIKPETYLYDTMKCLLSIAEGTSPAFIPADNSEQVGPTKIIQEALIDIYRLKTHFPNIMHVSLLNRKDVDIAYYSLAIPILLEGSPNSKLTTSTLMLDLKDLKLLMETIHESTILNFDVISDKKFYYFHTEPDIHNEITISTEIPNIDFRFKTKKSREFCSTSPFWRGSIMIKKENQE